MKYIVLRKLCQSELGWFSEIRRQGRETSRQRALNFDAPEVGVLFPFATSTDAIPITLERRDDEHQITRQDHSLRRQGKNWRLTGDSVLGQRFGAVMPGDLVIMALNLDGALAQGAFEILRQDDPAAHRILSDAHSARLVSNSLVAVPATDAPELVRELRGLDDGLFRSHLPTIAESAALNGNTHRAVAGRLEDFDVALFEPEEPGRAPEEDSTCRLGAAEVQAAIDGHTPVDTDAGWVEVLIDLPSEFYVVGRACGLDEDAVVLVRDLLQDGVIHGCVSARDLEMVVCPRSGVDPDPDLERRLRVVLDELGVEVEIRPWDEDLLPVDCRELSPDEEDLVNEALAFLMGLEPPDETPLEACQREVRAASMRSESEEVAMHAEVKAGMAETLKEIARSRAGVEEVMRVIHLIDNGERELRKVIVCGGDDDMAARLGEFRTNIIGVRALLPLRALDADDLIEEAAAREITSIFSRCGFTSQFLDEVCGRLLAEDQVGDIGTKILSGINRSKVARREIVGSNLRLVVWWASQYRSRGLELADRVGEGTIGLIRAVDRYDCSREATLSTYGSWWIKQSITRAMADQSGLIRTPGHVWGARRRVLDHRQSVEGSTGRRPTAEETARAVGIHPQAARFLLGEQDVHSMDTDDCLNLLAEARLLSSDGIPENTASDAELKETVQACLSTLEPRVRLVVQGRFGIGGDPGQTLEEMGRALGVTRERVRQIEAKAIQKLRHPGRARILAPFLGEVRPPAPPAEEHDES